MSTDDGINNIQKVKYRQLLTKKLPELIKQSSCSLCSDAFDVDYEMFPIDMNNIVSQEGTDYYPVRTTCKVKNNVSGEVVSFNVDLINVPVLYGLGFRIGGNFMQMLDSYERASGWSFVYDSRKGKEPPSINKNK